MLAVPVAWHTFAASFTLTNSVPIETVSHLPGHNKVSEDMEALKQKFATV